MARLPLGRGKVTLTLRCLARGRSAVRYQPLDGVAVGAQPAQPHGPQLTATVVDHRHDLVVHATGHVEWPQGQSQLVKAPCEQGGDQPTEGPCRRTPLRPHVQSPLVSAFVEGADRGCKLRGVESVAGEGAKVVEQPPSRPTSSAQAARLSFQPGVSDERRITNGPVEPRVLRELDAASSRPYPGLCAPVQEVATSFHGFMMVALR